MRRAHVSTTPPIHMRSDEPEGSDPTSNWEVEGNSSFQAQLLRSPLQYHAQLHSYISSSAQQFRMAQEWLVASF